MSKIKELFNDNKTIYVFDIDGVLAKIEYGQYNHYMLDDEAWAKEIEKGKIFYNDDLAINTMKHFIESKDITKIYVISKIATKKEIDQKIDFLKRNYSILENHVYYVNNNKEKLNILNKIHDKHKELDSKYIVMIDDNVDDVLSYIAFNSNYSTIHISSFM